MQQRWMRRSLPAAVFALFIILYVDSQLRTDARHARRSSAVPPLARSPGHARRAASSVAPSPPLEPEQIFIAVKTTGRFHGTRLALLLQTWISRTKEQVGSGRTAAELNPAGACVCVCVPVLTVNNFRFFSAQHLRGL